MRKKKIFLSGLVILFGLFLLGVWGLFFAGKLSILADFVSPDQEVTTSDKQVVKIVSPTPQEVVENGFNSGKDKINVVLDINGLSISETVNQPIDMVAVLDYTKSMNSPAPAGSKCLSDTEDGTKLDCAKKAFGTLVNSFVANNANRIDANELRLGLVTFNANFEGSAQNACSDPTGGIKTWNLTKQVDNSLVTVDLPTGIKNLGTCWGTNTGRAMQRAAEIFAAAKESDSARYERSKKVVILMTDGELNVGIDPTNNNAFNPFKVNDISIYTIGFGLADDPNQVVVDGIPPLNFTDEGSFDNYLWCSDSAENLVTKTINGKIFKYCLAKTNNEPNPKGLRLNALPMEAGGKYFYAPDSSTLNQSFEEVFAAVALTRQTAIEINENFDANYSYVDNSLTVSGPRGDLDLVSEEDFFKDNVGVDKYFFKVEPGSMKVWISKGSAVNGEKIKVAFDLNANITDVDSSIDVASNVKWGDIDKVSKNILDKGRLAQEDLPQYIYNLKVINPNNPNVPSSWSGPLLQTGVSVILLLIISIALVAAIAYILALIKEK